MRARFTKRLYACLAFALPLAAGRASFAGLTYYSTQAAFNAAAPGLPVDTFSGSGVRTGPYSNMTGLALNTTGGGASNLYFVDGGIAPNYFGDTLTLTFSPNATAVDIQVEGAPASGTNGPDGTLIADVYLIGSTTPTQTNILLATNTPYYFGVTSTTPITSIRLLYDYNSDASTVVSAVQYGAVPEPSAFLLCAGAIAPLFRRRRSVA